MAKRSLTLKKKNKRGGAFQFKTQDVNTGAPVPPNAPQGPLGGRRRRTLKKKGTKRGGGGEYDVPIVTAPPDMHPKGGRKMRKY